MFTFLADELESLALWIAVVPYVTLVGILQARNLKYLKKIRTKHVPLPVKTECVAKLRKLKRRVPAMMLIGFGTQAIAALFLFEGAVCHPYWISMGILYALFVSLAYLNFWLKGAGVMKDLGDFSGLPGN